MRHHTDFYCFASQYPNRNAGRSRRHQERKRGEETASSKNGQEEKAVTNAFLKKKNNCLGQITFHANDGFSSCITRKYPLWTTTRGRYNGDHLGIIKVNVLLSYHSNKFLSVYTPERLFKMLSCGLQKGFVVSVCL